VTDDDSGKRKSSPLPAIKNQVTVLAPVNSSTTPEVICKKCSSRNKPTTFCKDCGEILPKLGFGQVAIPTPEPEPKEIDSGLSKVRTTGSVGFCVKCKVDAKTSENRYCALCGDPLQWKNA